MCDGGKTGGEEEAYALAVDTARAGSTYRCTLKPETVRGGGLLTVEPSSVQTPVRGCTALGVSTRTVRRLHAAKTAGAQDDHYR